MTVGRIIGGFEYVREVGRGSRATVWEALRIETGERVALKVLDTAAGVATERLRREYEAQRMLDHDNVVRALDLVQLGESFAMVTELVGGPSLKAWLTENRCTPAEARRIFGGIVRGLRAAHEAGLVHRDLTPANILMAPSPGGPIPKIADFGLVKSEASASLTGSGMVIGTLRYMPPEQLNDPGGVDARADLFSLGCILFELYTGEKCFDAPNKVALMNIVRQKLHTPFPDDLDPAVRDVVDALVDPDPDRRLDSAVAVLGALHLPDVAEPVEPIEEPSSSPWLRGVVVGLLVVCAALAAIALAFQLSG